MSKLKVAYGAAKAFGKAYKMGRKTVTAKRNSKLGYQAAMRYRQTGMSLAKRTTSKAAAERIAKNMASYAKKAVTSGNARAKAATKLQNKGGLVKVGAHLGRNQNKYGALAGYNAAAGFVAKGRSKRKMSIKQKLALKKAQLASARKRRKN